MGEDRRIAHFGPFEFDLQTLELRKSRRRRPLQHKPASRLRILIERAGQTVSREELHRQLWPEGTFVDFEVGLNAAVRKLRASFGESKDARRYIVTDARPGYRFCFADTAPSS